MTEPQEDPPRVEVETASPPPPVVASGISIWIARLGRTLSRLWVVALLVTAAMGSGVALNQMFQAEMRLQSLRQEPGPDAYAIVAYRRELARQIELHPPPPPPPPPARRAKSAAAAAVAGGN
jgi:hypothetical protein